MTEFCIFHFVKNDGAFELLCRYLLEFMIYFILFLEFINSKILFGKSLSVAVMIELVLTFNKVGDGNFVLKLYSANQALQQLIIR